MDPIEYINSTQKGIAINLEEENPQCEEFDHQAKRDYSYFKGYQDFWVGTSAGFTTMLLIPKDCNHSWIQNPQNPAS